MTKKKLKELYDTNIAFKLYVDNTCKKHNWTIKQAFDDRVVQTYAQYIKQRGINRV